MSDGIFRKIERGEAAPHGGIRKLCCQGCGASLPVEEGVRFLTCNYCHSRLEVVSGRETTHTKVLDQLEARTGRIERKLDVIDLRSKLSELDGAWNRYRESVSSRDRWGNLQPPSMDLVLGVTIISSLVALVFVAIVFSQAPLMALVLAAVGILVARLFWKTQSLKARSYETSRAKYESRRADLLELIATCGEVRK